MSKRPFLAAVGEGAVLAGWYLTEDLDHLAKEHPDVMVLRRVAPGSPRTALLDAAAGAQMVVVGSRGSGGVPGMNLGSVAQAVLHYAPVPVGVVHPFASPGR
jgi:nucleotide-binding universal stress UspA family protein